MLPKRQYRKGKSRMPSMKAALAARDGVRCAYCGMVPESGDYHDLTRDHIVPKSAGGSNALSNQVLACQPCNQKKGNSVGLMMPVYTNLLNPIGLYKSHHEIVKKQNRPSHSWLLEIDLIGYESSEED